MSQNVYQFIDLQRVDPPKKPLKISKIELWESSRFEGQAKAQAGRPLLWQPYCKWKCPVRQLRPELAGSWPARAYFEAAELSHQTNTLPEVCGRVCPQDLHVGTRCTLNDEFSAP